MPLQHQTEEIAPPAPLIPAAETARYDTVVVQKVIALAEEMQTRHRQSLSSGEVEDLGREMGVGPEFVQQALAQIMAHSDKPTHAAAKNQKREHDSAENLLRPLTLRQWAVAAVPVVVYSLLMPLTFGWFSGNTPLTNTDGILLIALFFILPGLLALFTGAKIKSKRLGAFSGGLFGLTAMFLLITLMVAHDGGNSGLEAGSFYGLLTFFLGGGSVLGFVGAGVRQLITGQAKRRPRHSGANTETENWA